jgi:hypothetical protein
MGSVDGVKTGEDPEMFDEVQRATPFMELLNRVTT